MNSSDKYKTGGRLLALMAGLLAASLATSAPRFIANSRINLDGTTAEITIEFACNVGVTRHAPPAQGGLLRIELEPTAICNGAPPGISRAHEQHRPLQSEKARLSEIEYDGSGAGHSLSLLFSETVRFEVIAAGISNTLVIRVEVGDQPAAAVAREAPRGDGTRLRTPAASGPSYVINLSSSKSQHGAAELMAASRDSAYQVFETEFVLDGVTWYRLRLGYFDNVDAARQQLDALQGRFPNAWVDFAGSGGERVNESPDPVLSAADGPQPSLGLDELDQLMSVARQAMSAGEYPKAVQIYTKVLRAPGHDRQPEAQEMLALARQRNGQLAHAKAEYQRYLATFPDHANAPRVQQRLAALIADSRRTSDAPASTAAPNTNRSAPSRSDWRVQTFFSQYYRRDVNQFDDNDALVSQSALYSDINFDARRRGERFDFGSRVSAGYRNDFLGEGEGPGNELRLSYAYVDLADAASGFSGRLGRQSRTTGGVLGRFDGLNLDYRGFDRVSLNAVAGTPVYSASDDLDSSRVFLGASVGFSPVPDDLEMRVYYIQQDIEGIDDRQAVGTEFRYFGEKQSLWGLVDYDTSYATISSAFVQGSWRIAPQFSIHGSVDQRHTPFPGTRNALIGQPYADFSELLSVLSVEEIRQLSIDRTASTSTYSLGISHTLGPRLQLNADANHTTIGSTPESGGVAATAETNYRYYAASLTASSLVREGDVAIFGLRYSDSGATRSTSLSLDGRFPFGRYLRVNLRMRVDRREIVSDSSTEWQYLPGLRIEYRRSRKLRFELDIGKLFSQRDLAALSLDRESYFVNFGYQAFF